MQCPYCHQEMKVGYIYSGKGDICWTPEGEKMSWIVNRPHSTEVQFAKFSFFKGCKVKVFRCPNCQIDIINENDVELK